MSDKRTYSEVLASLETQMQYTNNHLQNIDQHLNRLNERTGDNEIDIAKNSERINGIYRIFKGIGIISGSIGGILAVVLKILGVY